MEVTLRFTTDEGRQVTASARAHGSLEALADLREGQAEGKTWLVPLRYNPENPEEIMIKMDLNQKTIQGALDKLPEKPDRAVLLEFFD